MTRAGSSGRIGRALGEGEPLPVPLVTVVALVLPGAGQMLNGEAMRGTIMQFFMMFLALVTYEVTAPSISFMGRFAGGFLVYVVSVIDANSVAKRRLFAYRHRGAAAGQ
jgi:hypothetical protein